jgi:hypothetical protein
MYTSFAAAEPKEIDARIPWINSDAWPPKPLVREGRESRRF